MRNSMQETRALQQVWVRTLTVFALGGVLWWAPSALAQEARSDDRSADIVAVVTKIDETRQLMEELSVDGIPQALAAIDRLASLSDAQKQSLKDQVVRYKEQIDPYLVKLRRYDSLFDVNDKLQKFVDFYGDYREMQTTAQALTYKPQQDLARLATLLKSHGADVPIIGKAL